MCFKEICNPKLINRQVYFTKQRINTDCSKGESIEKMVSVIK